MACSAAFFSEFAHPLTTISPNVRIIAKIDFRIAIHPCYAGKLALVRATSVAFCVGCGTAQTLGVETRMWGVFRDRLLVEGPLLLPEILVNRWQRFGVADCVLNAESLLVEVVAYVGVAVGRIVPQARVKRKGLIILHDPLAGVVD